MEDQNFRFIMDSNEDDESTLQYFAIKSEESLDDDQNLSITDIFGLPNEPDLENKQIFYLTFDQNTESNEGLSAIEKLGTPQSEETSDCLEQLSSGDVKLITLDDGRMFMARFSDDGLEPILPITTPILLDPHPANSISIDNSKHNEDSAQQIENEFLEDSEASYQLVQLNDGTQAVLKIYKTENEAVPEEEEPLPKKKKKYQCFYEGCAKVYATSYHLTVHMRTHTDCKPYECTRDGCDKKFATNYSLKAHIRTHTGEKPFSCSICTKQFKTSGDLIKHIRIHTGEKPFVCPILGCGRSFTTSNIRKVHIRSHTGERPYSCDYPNCGKAFTSSTNYKNHLRIHSGEKPYVCNVPGCNKRFTEYSSLYKHNAVHQPEKPYVCVFCHQKFKQESALNYHKRFKHSIIITKDGTEIIVKIE